MVGERDAVMARNLNALPSQLGTVVAVMGLGHLNEVRKNLQAKGWKVLSIFCKQNSLRPFLTSVNEDGIIFSSFSL